MVVLFVFRQAQGTCPGSKRPAACELTTNYGDNGNEKAVEVYNGLMHRGVL
ncbi:MAG: hypothetical protein MJA30_23875 [Cytophagales bacterium]|nr:hypothetical protein [Cytophagales bacterium]